MSDLQTSHDRLAHALVQFTDQVLRGSHLPTPQQWSDVSQALRGAAPLASPDGRANPAWLLEVAKLIDAGIQLEKLVGGQS